MLTLYDHFLNRVSRGSIPDGATSVRCRPNRELTPGDEARLSAAPHDRQRRTKHKDHDRQERETRMALTSLSRRSRVRSDPRGI